MCGICGIVNFESDPVDRAVIERMTGALAHRGPDDAGYFVDGPVGLGHRRLSIIDLSGGRQPIFNEDRSAAIVFNGEIYNYRDLAPVLTAAGHTFKTRSDTETILHAYEEYGDDCVQRLRGMFGFAIWDRAKRRLLLARDRLGVKPVYYYRNSRFLAFASEIKSLLEIPSIPREVDPESLDMYLSLRYVLGPRTMFKNIFRLQPGHILVADDEGVRTTKYWDIDYPDPEPRSPEYLLERFRELLDESVRLRLIAEVPLGVFLSGGLDSSAVAAFMTKIRRAPVETFSVGYAESAFSELPHARRVAKHLKSVHHEVLVSSEDFFDTLPTLVWHEDEPTAWPSSVALYFVARLAREHVSVVLTGEGSDETLAGYTRYAFSLKNAAIDQLYRRLVSEPVRRRLRRSIADSGLLNATFRRKLAHTFLARDGNSWSSFYFDNFFSAFSQEDQAGLLTDDTAARLTDNAAYRNVMEYWDASSGDLLRRMLYADVKTYLVELLMKQDNMSMAASVESRVPFLDHDLVEFAMGIPQSFQVRGLAGKRILKKAVTDLLPDSVINQRKLGFPTPWSAWLKGARLNTISSLLLEPRSIDRGLFKQAAIECLFGEHRTRYRDHADRIWRLLNLELWFRVCVEGESGASAWTRSGATKSVAAV